MKPFLLFFLWIISFTYLKAQGSVSFINLTAEFLSGKEIRVLFEDSRQNVWIGTKGQGIYRFSNNQLAEMTSKTDGLLPGCITIEEDVEGRIWFGGRGVMIYDGNHFKRLDQPIKSSVVFTIYRDRLGQMWLGGNRGVDFRTNLGGWIHFDKEDGLSDDVVHSIAEDKAGGIWLATRRGGLNYFDQLDWQVYLPETNCRKILASPKGDLWIGTNKGTFHIDPKYRLKNKREGEILIPEIISGRSDIWFSTEGSGIFHYRKKKWKQYNNSGGLMSNTVYSMIKTQDGNLWIGTDQGLGIIGHSDLRSN